MANSKSNLYRFRKVTGKNAYGIGKHIDEPRS